MGRIKSYFGRVLVDIDNKYGVNLSSRIDNSNLYADLEIFGSLAVNWKLHNEPFIGDWAAVLNLKLSYGNAGNLGANRAAAVIFNDQIATRFESVPVGGGGGIELSAPITQFENENLSVERTSEWSAATEFAIKNTGLTGELSFYHRTSSNLTGVGNTPIFTFALENIDAAIVNKGVELQIGHTFSRNDLTLRTRAMVSYNENNLTQFDRTFTTGLLYGQGLSGITVQRFTEDFSVFSYYLPEFQGYDSDGFQVLGNLEMQDKSAIPTTSLGFDFGLDYRKLSLDLNFYGLMGHYVYNNTENAFFSIGAIANGSNVTREVLDSEQSIFATNSPSTQFLERGDFLRCRSIIINYQFDARIGKLKEFEVFGLVQNPFLITGYSGLDPEVNMQVGIDYLAYPMARTYSVGFKASL